MALQHDVHSAPSAFFAGPKAFFTEPFTGRVTIAFDLQENIDSFWESIKVNPYMNIQQVRFRAYVFFSRDSDHRCCAPNHIGRPVCPVLLCCLVCRACVLAAGRCEGTSSRLLFPRKAIIHVKKKTATLAGSRGIVYVGRARRRRGRGARKSKTGRRCCKRTKDQRRFRSATAQGRRHFGHHRHDVCLRAVSPPGLIFVHTCRTTAAAPVKSAKDTYYNSKLHKYLTAGWKASCYSMFVALPQSGSTDAFTPPHQ